MKEALPPEPRELIWQPIDPGDGDGDIPVPKKLPGRKHKGLTGGGAGGLPAVPEWFVQWQQRDNEYECNAVEHHLSELGLRVLQARCAPENREEALSREDLDRPEHELEFNALEQHLSELGVHVLQARCAPEPDSDILASAGSECATPSCVAPNSVLLGECMLPYCEEALSFADLDSREHESECTAMEQHLSELGLGVRPARCPPSPDLDILAPAGSDRATPTCAALDSDPPVHPVLVQHGAALTGVELNSLEGQNFITDGIIKFVFAQMSSSFTQQEAEEIVLVPPSITLLLANLDDPEALAAIAAELRLSSPHPGLFSSL